jgi:hypothetical protein
MAKSLRLTRRCFKRDGQVARDRRMQWPLRGARFLRWHVKSRKRNYIGRAILPAKFSIEALDCAVGCQQDGDLACHWHGNSRSPQKQAQGRERERRVCSAFGTAVGFRVDDDHRMKHDIAGYPLEP